MNVLKYLNAIHTVDFGKHLDRDLRNLRKFNDDGTLRTREDELAFRNKERALQKEKERFTKQN